MTQQKLTTLWEQPFSEKALDPVWTNEPARQESFEKVAGYFAESPLQAGKVASPTGEVPTNELHLDQRAQFVIDNFA